ncbi:MAG: hypothetical protein K0S01_1556 [Herbinix sp.]|nr:hypothetical protein [Herbinix sp.]
MNVWRVLFLLEYEWRVFRIYRKLINWLVKRGMKLSSPILCKIKRKLDNHNMNLMELKRKYEKQTGQVIIYYKCDEI